MKTQRPLHGLVAVTLSLLSVVAPAAGVSAARDRMWVWGNPEMATEGPHTLASFPQASPIERASLLGVPNVVLAGLGLPNNDGAARALLNDLANVPRVVLEIAPDGEGENRPFVYTETIARVRRLANEYPNIEGVLLDDMSTVSIDKGFKPQHIRDLRQLLGEDHQRIKIWGVLYTMSLGQAGIDEYVHELDVINLWTWHARDIADLDANVAQCEARFPDKPIVLGLYLHDYGDGRPMPQDLLERQHATALTLLSAGRVQSLVFLTIDDAPEALTWSANWINQVGDQPVSPSEGVGSSSPSARGVAGEGIPITLGDASGWAFIGEPWIQDAAGIIRPPDAPNLHSRAFHIESGYRTFSADFEFNGDYRETGTGSAGLIFGATAPNHFYYLWFPWGGQQLRAKHFWAALAKVDGDGYIRNIAMEWVPGVPSETDRWYHVRLEANDSHIKVWVDGRKALSLHGHSERSKESGFNLPVGRIGLAGYGWYAFRNIRIAGEPAPAPSWDTTTSIPNHAVPLALTSEKMPTGCVAPNGDVLLAAGTRLIRSRDRGRTWNDPEPLPEQLGELTDYGSTLFRTSGDRLIAMIYRPQSSERPVPEILISDSPDSGVTWSEPVASAVAPEWPTQPANLVPYGPLVETVDGTLLRFLLGGVKEEGDTFTDVITWSSIHAKAFTIRSRDGGASWSAPIEIDQPSWVGKARGTISGSLDLTEPTGVAIGNVVTVLVRPIYSPTMWQCWSQDAGATWDAAARATFPGYAQSAIRTASGTILCAHRYPHYSVNVSYDNGLNWDAGTVIDYPVWAMGCAIEVEPDLVLFTYMNAQQNMPLLAQRVRVTPVGIVPATD